MERASGAGADGDAEGAEDAVTGGAIPFHVGPVRLRSSASLRENERF